MAKQKQTSSKAVLPTEQITRSILFIRKQKVILSSALAQLYGVEPKVLVQAVQRNIDRFPKDFMFQLTKQDVSNLKSQIVTSSWGGSRRWATQRLKEYLVQGYTLNQVRFEQNADELEQALALIRKAARSPAITAEAGKRRPDPDRLERRFNDFLTRVS